jgi:single-strand DNA-binding protein
MRGPWSFERCARKEVNAAMRGVNKVILVGNATRDAELRHTESGKSVSNIRLATNRRVNGEEKTQFHTVVCWDTLAETTGKYVKRGRLIYVEGRLEYRTFTDDESKDRGVVEIVASDVQFLGGRGDSDRANAEATASGGLENGGLDEVPL